MTSAAIVQKRRNYCNVLRPETRQTHERLPREGHWEAEAIDLLGAAIAVEIHYILKRGTHFDHDRYVKTLNNLPMLPK